MTLVRKEKKKVGQKPIERISHDVAKKCVRQLTMYRERAAIRVIIVERHAHVRKEIRSLLEQDGEMEIAGVTRLPENVLSLIRVQYPDVVLTEAGHPDGDGLQACREIRWQFPDTRIIFFAAKAEPDMIRRAISAGCHGYLVEPLASRRIVPAVKTVAQNGFYFEQGSGLSMDRETQERD